MNSSAGDESGCVGCSVAKCVDLITSANLGRVIRYDLTARLTGRAVIFYHGPLQLRRAHQLGDLSKHWQGRSMSQIDHCSVTPLEPDITADGAVQCSQTYRHALTRHAKLLQAPYESPCPFTPIMPT